MKKLYYTIFLLGLFLVSNSVGAQTYVPPTDAEIEKFILSRDYNIYASIDNNIFTDSDGPSVFNGFSNKLPNYRGAGSGSYSVSALQPIDVYKLRGSKVNDYAETVMLKCRADGRYHGFYYNWENIIMHSEDECPTCTKLKKPYSDASKKLSRRIDDYSEKNKARIKYASYFYLWTANELYCDNVQLIKMTHEIYKAYCNDIEYLLDGNGVPILLDAKQKFPEVFAKIDTENKPKYDKENPITYMNVHYNVNDSAAIYGDKIKIRKNLGM